MATSPGGDDQLSQIFCCPPIRVSCTCMGQANNITLLTWLSSPNDSHFPDYTQHRPPTTPHTRLERRMNLSMTSNLQDDSITNPPNLPSDFNSALDDMDVNTPQDVKTNKHNKAMLCNADNSRGRSIIARLAGRQALVKRSCTTKTPPQRLGTALFAHMSMGILVKAPTTEPKRSDLMYTQ
jgi:hypothetical protein